MTIIIIFMLMISNCNAQEYVYFRGVRSYEALEESTYLDINVWNTETNEVTFTGVRGYLIDKDASEPGVWAVLEEFEGPHDEINIVRMEDGSIQESHTVELKGDVIRIYAIKNEWIYYGYKKGENDFGVRRMKKDGTHEEYLIENTLFSEADLHNSIFAFSDEGILAYTGSTAHIYDFDEDYEWSLYLCKPGKKSIPVKEVQPHYYCWLDNDNLLFAGDDNQMYIGNIAEKTIETYIAENGQPVAFECTSNICINSDKTHIAYQQYEYQLLFGFWKMHAIEGNRWYPLTIHSLIDGTTKTLGYEVMTETIFYNYSPQMLFGK